MRIIDTHAEQRIKRMKNRILLTLTILLALSLIFAGLIVTIFGEEPAGESVPAPETEPCTDETQPPETEPAPEPHWD